jgi:hypothetical protein
MEPLDLDDLPRAYRIGLRLHEMGADDEFIADCLGIDTAGVSTLIEIGRQKLAAERQLGLSDRDLDSSPATDDPR